MNLKLTAGLCLVCSSVFAANVADNIQTALGVGLSGTNRIRFTPVQPWLLSSNASPVIGFPVGANTDTNGNFGATNIVGPAYYNIDVVNSGLPPLRGLVPGGNATYTLWQIAQFAQQAQYFQWITNTFIGTNGVNVAPGALMFASTNPAGPLVTVSALSQTNTVVQTNDTRAVTLYNQVGGTNSNNTLQYPTNTGIYWGQQYPSGAFPMRFSMDTTNGIRLDDGLGDVLNLGSNNLVLTDIANDGLFTHGSGASGSVQIDDGGGDIFLLQSGKASLSTGAQFAGNGAGITNTPFATNSLNATNLIGALAQANIPSSLNYTGAFSGNASSLFGVQGPISNIWNRITPELPPFNAKGDGTTDDTVALQKALDTNNVQIAAGIQSKIILAPGANYKVTANLKLFRFNIEGNAMDWTLGSTPTINFTGTAGFVQTNGLLGNMRISQVAIKGSGMGGQILLLAGNTNSVDSALRLDHVSFVGADTAILMTNMDELNFDTVLAFQCTNGIKSYWTNGAPIQASLFKNYHANCYGESFYGEGGNYHFIDLDSSGIGNSHQIHVAKNSTILLDNPNIEGPFTDTNHFNFFSDNCTVIMNLGAMNQTGTTQPCMATTNTSHITIHYTTPSSDASGNHIKSWDGNNTDIASDLTLGILDVVNGISYKTTVNHPGVLYAGTSGSGLPQNLQPFARIFVSGDGSSSGAGRVILGGNPQNAQFANYIAEKTEGTGPNNITTEFGGVWGNSASEMPWFYLRNNNTGQGFVGVGNSNPQANFDNAGSTLLENGLSITNAATTNWSTGGTPIGLVRFYTNLAAGIAPNAVYPNGSECITTNGAYWLRTNNTWLQK